MQTDVIGLFEAWGGSQNKSSGKALAIGHRAYAVSYADIVFYKSDMTELFLRKLVLESSDGTSVSKAKEAQHSGLWWYREGASWW